jgi:hypothetical protein
LPPLRPAANPSACFDARGIPYEKKRKRTTQTTPAATGGELPSRTFLVVKFQAECFFFSSTFSHVPVSS